MTKQKSDCCKAEIQLTGKDRPDAFCCSKCKRIIGKPRNDWEKCYKINCTPPLEVYKTHINFFGSNVYPEEFGGCIRQAMEKLNYWKEAVRIWEKKFNDK